ncbi:MAG: CHAT domain-containing protein [Gammaproteobacteria bacterium]
MRFNKICDAPGSIKRLSTMMAFAMTVGITNIGCHPVITGEHQAATASMNYKKWVLDAETLREQGDLISAQKKLDLALQTVQNDNAPPLDVAAVEMAAGYNLLLLNKLHAAEQYLTSAYPKTTDNHYLHALADQYLANYYFANDDNAKARSHISHGLSLLPADEHEDLRLSLELLELDTSPIDLSGKAEKLLQLAPAIEKLPNNAIKSKLVLKATRLILRMEGTPLPLEIVSTLQQHCYRMLDTLSSWAEKSQHPRLEAEALGQMATLYRWQGRIEEAIQLLEQALSLSQQQNQPELVAQLAAKKGELLRLTHDNEGALAAYETAVDNLYAIRADVPITLLDGQSALQTMIDPIYRNYVDLLLDPERKIAPEKAEPLLTKAIDSMEAIKEADLQDFFLGRCSFDAENSQNWKNLSFPNVGILYPILLKDRAELLLKIGSKLIRHTVNIPADQVQKQTLALITALERGKDYRSASKQLYQWLFSPIEEELRKADVNVILYVPDRSLRAAPLTAFSDGGSFLVERYAVVTLPNLAIQSLSRVNAHQSPELRALLAGLSKPDGASIDQLPSGFTGQNSDTPRSRDAIIEELSLPSVEEEIRTVAEKEQSTTLLNDQFTASALRSDIETGDYGKVHIASHGYFGKNAKESFIMTYDQNMTLLDIKNTLEAENLKAKPIDLLTLSACKTAEGDDSMLLGFSGLAVQSNVLSAVGSLWAINDAATMEFMRLFYDELAQSHNKALALRKAQVAMIKSKKFRHPFYWSSFILIGDWK